MPLYQITDSQTGRTLVVEGDTPPTDQDASQLFDSRAGQAAIAVFKAQQQRDISNIKLDPYQQIQMQGQQGAMEEGNADFLTSIGRNPVGFVKSLPADAAQLVEGAAAGIGNLPVRAYRALAGTPQLAVIQKDANGRDVLVQEPKPLPFQPNQPVVQFPRTVMQPEGSDLERMVEGLLTPGNIAAFPFAAAKPVQAYFLAQTAPGAIDAASRLFSPGMSGDERKSAATDLLLSGLMSYGMAKGILHQAAQPGMPASAEPAAEAAPQPAPGNYSLPTEPTVSPAPAAPAPKPALPPVEQPEPIIQPGPIEPPSPAALPEPASPQPPMEKAYPNEGPGSPADQFGAIYGPNLNQGQMDKFADIVGQEFDMPAPAGMSAKLKVKPNLLWMEMTRPVGKAGQHEVGVAYLKIQPDGTTILNAGRQKREIDAAAVSGLSDFLANSKPASGPTVTPALPPESSLPAAPTAPAQPEASATPTPPAPTNFPNVGEQPAAGKPQPSIIPNPITEEDVAQNAVAQGKPLDAQFVADNGFESQLTEHGYIQQGDQWVPKEPVAPAAETPSPPATPEPLNQWGVPESQWREMAKFTSAEQQRRWGTTRAKIMEQVATAKAVEPLHPYKVGDEVMYQGKKQKVTRAVPGGSFIGIGRRAVHIKDVQPVEAAAKVADHVEQVASGEKAAKPDPALDARTGPRAAKEIKAELVSRLEAAIKKAPAQSGKRITISIPGDGEFTVFNNKADLGHVLKAAKALDTSPTGRVARLPQTSSIGSHVDRVARIQRDAVKVYGSERNAIARLREQAANKDLEMDPRQREDLGEAADLLEANLPEKQLAKTKQAVEDRITDLNELLSMAQPRLDEARSKVNGLKADIARRLSEKKGVSKLRDAQSQLERQIREIEQDMQKKRQELARLENDLPGLNERLNAAQKEARATSVKPKSSKGVAGSVPLLGDGGELGEGKPPGTTPTADDRSFSAFNAMPMGMPEAVRVAKALTGVYPKIREHLGRYAGVFRYRQGEGARGHIEILASQFRVISDARMKELRQQAADYARAAAEEGDNPKDIANERYDYLLQQEVIKQPVAALKTMWHEIGHVVDWLPEHIIPGRGNILGRIASLQKFTKHALPFDPSKPAGEKITAADKARLMKEAQEALRKEMGPILEMIKKIIVEEPEWRIVGITPEDIKNILRENAGKDTPELTRWFSEQSDKTKADILRKAMRGMVDERLSALGKKEQVGTRRTERTVREKVGREPTPEEIKARFAELLAKEIKARNLADLATIKEELSGLIAWWRGTPIIPDYFKEASEMYADAFSVWANNPAAVLKRAPTYAELMWNYLDRKPEVKALYDEIQGQIKSGQIMGHRVSDLLAMWDGDDARSLGLAKERWATSRRDFYDNVVYHFDRRFGPIYRAAKGYAGQGRVKEAVAQFLYRATEHERFLGDLNRVVGTRLVKAGLDWSHDLGEYLYHQRVIHERFNLANPKGFTPKDSADRLAEMQQQLGPERWRELETAAREWHELYQKHVVQPVVASGMFTPELAEILVSRAHYATFAAIKGVADDGLQRIIDQRFGKTNGPQIYRQIGNLGEIKNPATATVLKGLSLISAVYRNDMKRQIVEMLRDKDPENIVPARTRWNGKFNEPVFIQNHDKVGTVAFMQAGKLHAFYVRKVVADAVNGASPTENKIFNAFVKVNGWSKALFTQLNYAFWPVNFVRDTAGFMYQMPGFPALAYAKNLPKALAAARQSVLHAKPNPIADEALRRKLVISKADPRGVYAQADNEFELKVASHGMAPAAWEREHGKVAAIVRAWNWYRELGETIERVNKISGMLYLDQKYPNMPEWEKREIIRERSGSPNFLERGASNPAVDMLFLFYNPWKEGVRSVAKAARDNPFSFASKAVLTIAMPTVLQAAAVNGWLGANRKKEYASIPDYDLTNYLCVPLGWADEGQRKIVYLRLPLWEPARIAHGSLFQTLTGRGAGIINNAGGQLPGINPVWQVGLAWSEYALGKNPVDLDRAANVMPDTTFQAGGLPALQQMGEYTWNTMGGSILTRFKNLNLESPPQTVGEKFLALPVINNALGRWIKVSNSGLRDQDQATIAGIEKQRAQIRLAAQQIADKILTQQALTQSERVMLREPYAQQYLARILPDMAKSRASMQYKRLSSAPDLESRAAIAKKLQN